MINNSMPTMHKQQGAVLIVSLLVLLVLTIIGLSNLDNSLMEEKMAANTQISTTTFQAADSAIREKYYEERMAPALAVVHAQDGETADCDHCGETSGLTSRTRMVYPETIGKTPIYNSSSVFVAHGIEIIGSATYHDIEDSNAQGYSVYPMRP